jgi:hypothetical protein
MTKTTSIPTFLLEEDNESFIVWQYAKQNKIIKSENNTLLHVDAHIDMATPRLKTSIFNVENNFNQTVDLAYNELCINSYIVPAIYLGLFDRIHWLNGSSKEERLSRKRIVRTFNNEGKKFIIYNPNKYPIKYNGIYKKFVLTEDSINSLKIINHENIILNLNLNYFACVREPEEYKVNYIEITKNEYNQFKNNLNYHPLRYALLGNRIEAVKENDKYYYIINDHDEIYSSTNKSDKDIISKEIKQLISKLAALRAKFKLISITRSTKSGYTPDDIVDFIEKEVLDALKIYYPIKVERIEHFLHDLNHNPLS